MSGMVSAVNLQQNADVTKNMWILDSEATYHMTSDRSMMFNARMLATNESVKLQMAGGDILLFEEVGSDTHS